jgi:hypothetical protein
MSHPDDELDPALLPRAHADYRPLTAGCWQALSPPKAKPMKPPLSPIRPLPAVSGQFQMRRNIRYQFDHSADLQAWNPIHTNYSAGCGLGELFKFVEPLTNLTGFYRAKASLVPTP